MIRLLAVSDLQVRGVTVNRMESLERLAENGYPVTTKLRGKYPTAWDIDWADIVFFLRAVTADDLAFIKLCKEKGKKIWLDTDDDLLSTPLDHRGHFDFQVEDLRKAYKECHWLADYATYSTATLAASHDKLKRGSVIPCSYPDEVVSRLTAEGPTSKTVYWRGTDTHEKSMDEFGPAIVQVMNANPTWRIEFFGWKPWKILESLKCAGWYVHPFYDVATLLDKLHGLRAAVNICPRHDDAFTQARSSISAIEATFSGAVTVAPDWDEWKLPGVINYRSVADFAKKFETAIHQAGKPQHKKRWGQTAAYVRANRTWSATNKLHYEAIQAIMGA